MNEKENQKEEYHTQEGMFNVISFSFAEDTQGYRYVLIDTEEGKRFRTYSKVIYEQMAHLFARNVNPPFQILIVKRFSKKHQTYFTIWRVIIDDVAYGFKRIIQYGRYVGISLYEAKRDTQLWQKEKRITVPDFRENVADVLFDDI